jgi:chloramphenicol 3-O-phosphotransferase
MGAVIILSGPIGAGKTTVSKALVDLWSGPLAYIEGDAFWPFLVKPRTGGARQNFPTLIASMVAAARPVARADYDVLLDFSIPPSFLPTAQRILREVPLDFVLLRPPLDVCATRARERPEGKILDYDEGFYGMFDAEVRHIIGEDAPEPAVAAQRIRDGLATGQFRVTAG